MYEEEEKGVFSPYEDEALQEMLNRRREEEEEYSDIR